MILRGVILLAADGARSRAYIQALVNAQIYPASVILFGVNEVPQSYKDILVNSLRGIFLPDINQPVVHTCRSVGIPITCFSDENVNATVINEAVRKLSPEIVIYAGASGQIVSKDSLSTAPHFLHMHSGRLPNQRGSTTLYYSLLAGLNPAVSAILLDSNIDTGPIVMSRDYPFPPADMDLDFLYDSAIRADLLVRVMFEYQKTGSLNGINQVYKECEMHYFVIHPVLKHLGMLSLNKSTNDDAGI
jgi:methionyl-tRNA formyltransferase